MKIIERFARFIVRLWPVWLPLCLIFALPFTRPFGGIISDALVELVLSPFTEEMPGEMPAASAYPADLDLQIWHRWDNRRNSYRYYYGEPDTDQSAIIKLRQRFPAEPLFIAPPLQHQLGLSSLEFPYYSYTRPGRSKSEIAAELKRLREAVIAGRKLEPNNAFWWVSLAQIEWRSKNYDATLRALERAANCPRYDDYTMQLARRLVRARQRYGDATLFENLDMMEDARSSDDSKRGAVGAVWSAHARRVRAKGDVARALRWCGALITVGDLMQRDPNARGSVEAGALWQRAAYSAAYPPKATVIVSKRVAYFANFARQNGRADLADKVPQIEARSRAVQGLLGDDNWRYRNLVWLHPGQLDKIVNLLEALPACATAVLCYLSLWWMSANLFLWRARGEPSSRRDRVWLSLVTIAPLLALGGAGLWFVLSSAGRSWPFDYTMGSLAVFAFFGAPFLLAASCSLVTMRRHRADFALPPRVDMEMRLSPGARAFVRWFLPLCVASSVALLLIGWALFLVANWRDWGNVDLLKLLPPDRQGETNSLLWDSTGVPLPLIYGVFLCCVSLVIWFGRWRWTVPARVRPFTQGALRWWKESLGASMVIVAWFSLALALASWSVTQSAEARLERVLKNGELAVTRELQTKATQK